MINLHEDVLELFAELDGREAYFAALAGWGAWVAEQRREALRVYRSDPARRAKAVEQVRKWRIANPEKARANLRSARTAWSKRNPAKQRAIKANQLAKRRADPIRGPLLRARDARLKAAERARKKAALAAMGGAS